MIFCAKNLNINMYLPVDHTKLACVSHLTVKKRARKKITFLFSCVTDVSFTFKHLQQRADL